MTDFSTQKNSHSPIFDEVKIALAEHTDVPILKALATRIQAKMFESFDDTQNISVDKNNKGTNEAIDESEKKATDDKHKYCSQGDIRRANHILKHLTDTPNADASVLLVLTDEPKPKLMLTKRAGHLNNHAGEVSFAGGKHDEGDGNNMVTALREASEETGLPSRKVKIIGQLPVQISKTGLTVRPIVALAEPDVIYVPELGEIDRIFWADFTTLVTEPTVDYAIPFRLDNNDIQIVTPGWLVDDETVWGLTARVIGNLLEVGFDRKIAWYFRPEMRPEMRPETVQKKMMLDNKK